MLRPENRQNTRLSQAPTYLNRWLWRVETLGPINTTGITFFSELGRRLTDIYSGDPRETSYLFQRVSLAVQRYNSVAFMSRFVCLIGEDILIHGRAFSLELGRFQYGF